MKTQLCFQLGESILKYSGLFMQAWFMFPASDNYYSFPKINVKRKGNGIHDDIDHLNNYDYADSK